MKTRYVGILAVMLFSCADAEEILPGSAIPQPRLRLDPSRQSAITERQKPEKSGSPDSVISMSPVVVRASRIDANGANAEQDRLPTGPFSALSGGWIYRKKNSSTLIDVGVWPYRNILWKTDRFKSDLKHAGTEFVLIMW